MNDLPTLYTNPDALAAHIGAVLIELGFQPKAPQSLWTKAECATYLKCSIVQVDVLIRQKNLPCIDIAGVNSKTRDLRFSPEAVKAWVAENQK